MVLWSKRTRQVVALLELVISWEERIEKAHERKHGKYQPLILEIQQQEWKAWNPLVEVGCRASQAITLESIGSPWSKRASPQEVDHRHHQVGGDSIKMALAEGD